MILVGLAGAALLAFGTEAAGFVAKFPSSAPPAEIHLSLRGKGLWPAATTLRLLNNVTGEVLTRRLSTDDPARLRGVEAAAGRYRLIIEADHHRRSERDLLLPVSGLTLGEIRLDAAPVVTGVVRREDGAPVRGAEVLIDESRIATTDARGAFQAELPEPQPPALRIRKRGMATKAIVLPRITGEVALQAIVLASSPAELEVRVEGLAGEADLLLSRATGADRLPAGRAHLAATARPAVFRDLEAGTYVLEIYGAEPLQKHSSTFEVRKGERRSDVVKIHPFRVDGRLFLGQKPLAHAALELRHAATNLVMHAHTDDEGRFGGEAWEPGAFLIAVTRGPLRSAHTLHVELHDGPLTLVLPDHQIRGRVMDLASGRPVPEALVLLRTRRAEGSSTVSQPTQPDGSFLFNSVDAGAQQLTVIAEGYLIASPAAFETDESDTSREMDVTIDSGIPAALKVVDHESRPVAGAAIVSTVDGALTSMSHTDRAGNAVIPLSSQPGMIFAIAREGSFAALGSSEVAERVVIPAPVSSLRITARARIGRLPPTSLLMSFNGRIIPPTVAQRLRRMQNLSLQIDQSGELVLNRIPPGVYQFWPYRTEEEAELIMAGGAEAPIKVDVRSGENSVVVEFERTTAAGH